MSANSTTVEARLAKLGIELPDAPTPFGAYVPAVRGRRAFRLVRRLNWK